MIATKEEVEYLKKVEWNKAIEAAATIAVQTSYEVSAEIRKLKK